MTNDKEFNQQPLSGPEQEENSGSDRTEQFNELSELSLEERMNVADQIGVPVYNMSDAVATGTARGADDVAEGSNDRLNEESSDNRTDQESA